MLTLILAGAVAFLYLAGLALAAEYVDTLEEEEFKEGIPKMPRNNRLLFLLAWPYHIITAIFSGSHDDR